MLGHHHRGLSLAPAGQPDPDLTRHIAALSTWRRRSLDEQRFAFGSDDAPFLPSPEPTRGRVRLGLFCPCLGLGGAEAWQLALIRAIDPAAVVWRGAVVTEGKRLVAPAMLGELSSRMPVGYGLPAARTLAAETDVVISWSVLDHGSLFHGIASPPRVALACHFPGERPWTANAELLLEQVDRLVAVSELAIEALPRSRQPTAQIIWNAVDGDRLQPTRARAATRTEWGIPAEAKVAGYLGRLSPEKDPAAMLRLAQAIPPPWHVVLVGDGRERPTLERQIADLGLTRVRLIPGSAEVGNVLAAFDTLVVPSQFESFGLTMAEGFWSEVPVVATRSGLAKLFPDLVRAIGFVSSGAEIAQAIQLDHGAETDQRRERVARARRFAVDRLDLARFGREWTNLVRDLARPDVASQPKEGQTCRPTLSSL